jgi:hypothetical protein
MRDEELIGELRRKAEEYRARAASCDKTADALELGCLNGQPARQRPSVPQPAAAGQPRRTNPSPNRMQQIGRFLARHGPATRSEVIAGAGVPAGSVRAVLNRNFFERDDETGRWVKLKDDAESE